MSGVTSFQTDNGRTIYCFQVEAFPTLIANIYVIDDGDRLILVDTGSGRDVSNQGLLDGFAALGKQFDTRFTLADVDLIVITHGHIDHFGGLPFVRRHCEAPIAVHRLDRRVLSHYTERVVVASKRLQAFLEQAGVSPSQRQTLMGVYLFAKGVYRSTPVQVILEEGEAIAGIDVYHVPGHCPGQVCLRVDDILLTADHVLSYTTPHQAPESITLNMGLGHYLDSLDKVAALPPVALALGGHEGPITNLRGRIAAIKQLHRERLQKVLAICEQPRSISAISRALFGEVSSYHVLLALEETGAHVEYLYQRGELQATNLVEIERETNPIILYRRT